MKLFLSLIFIVIIQQGCAAQDAVSFDQLSFAQPANWTFADNGSYRTYMTIDTSANTFCIISMYSSQPSSGNYQEDFSAAWKANVADHFTTAKVVKPQPLTTSKGMRFLQDDGIISNDKGQFFVRLMLFEFPGKTQAVLLLLHNKNDMAHYQSQLAGFLSSLAQNKNNTADTNNNNTADKGSAKFDDGWNAAIKEDYVLLTKNNCKVYLYYGEKFTDENRDHTVDYFYTRQLLKQYVITNAHARSDQFRYFIEGDATENSTGKQCYVLMEVIAYSGVASTIIEVAPTLDELVKQIGTDYNKLREHNHFGINLKDMAGTWSSSGSSMVNYYDAYNGNPAGTNAVVTDKKFIFNTNGTYESEFKGASGMVGNMRFYQETEKGSVTVLSPWQISTTDEKKKVTLYDCWFEAIRGGVILHVVNHEYTASAYALVKAK